MKFRIHYNTVWGESLVVRLPRRTVPMKWAGGGYWEAEVRGVKPDFYRYAVVRDGLIVRMERDPHVVHAETDFWQDGPCLRAAGTAVPVFALRSDEDFGIGEFLDLIPLIDWAVQTGQSIIQLLPVTDTTRKGEWKDSYPYSPVSSFALHPMYANLRSLGVRPDEKLHRELNDLPQIDYPRVFKEKTRCLKQAWDKADKESYKPWAAQNADWLDEYSSFCAMRDGDDPEYHKWLQYELDRQFGRVADYARGRGVSLKGDLPIGVGAESADAYFHPELFNLDMSAGAPPDFFSTEGQNWGFPTYNWEAMAKDGYAWWKRRLKHMSRYFDAFRIDHILGFFRIWEIPSCCEGGRMGHFNPALPYSTRELEGLPLDGLFLPDPRRKGFWHPMISPDTSNLTDAQRERFNALWQDFFFHRHEDFWRRNALKKLPELLCASGMLACGEDLGMVPDCVPGVMDALNILSLEMPCMDKGRPSWPVRSVCTTSSHDMDTLRMQQSEDPEPWEVKRLLWDCLCSASMLAVIPIQDWLALSASARRADRAAERINQPADPNHHWCYRMHLPVDALKDIADMNSQMEGLLKDSNRYKI